MSVVDLLRQYSSRPDEVVLTFPTESWNSTPGVMANQAPENVLGIAGTVLMQKLPVPGVTQRKADQFKKKTQDTAVVYRTLNSVARATADTPMMLGVLSNVPDCPHSHLVLELNILACLLKLPPQVQLAACVHLPLDAPELVMVPRADELAKTLLNDVFVRNKLERSRLSGQASSGEAGGGGGHLVPAAGGTGAAGCPAADAAANVPATQNSRTGKGGDAAAAPAAGGTPEVQQVRRGLQQQSLFGL